MHPEGVASVISSPRTANGLVQGILDRVGLVMGIDALQKGSGRTPRNSGVPGFTWFNQTDDANRVRDILTALAYLQNRSGARTVNLVDLEIGGVWSYFGRSMVGPRVNLTADLAQFSTGSYQEYIDRFFIPGLRKGVDFKAAAVLDRQDRLFLYNAGSRFRPIG